MTRYSICFFGSDNFSVFKVSILILVGIPVCWWRSVPSSDPEIDFHHDLVQLADPESPCRFEAGLNLFYYHGKIFKLAWFMVLNAAH